MKRLLLILFFLPLFCFSQQFIQGNSVSVDSNGLILYGSATVWDDLFFPFTTGTNGGNTYPTFSADSMVWRFVTDTTGPSQCIQYFCVQLPHSWKQGSTVFPHVHYKYTTSQGVPQFRVKYKWMSVSGTTSVAWKWYILNANTGTTNKSHQMNYRVTGISGSGQTISSILVCQVYLYSQTGTGGIDAYQFDIHFEKDGLGSPKEVYKPY